MIISFIRAAVMVPLILIIAIAAIIFCLCNKYRLKKAINQKKSSNNFTHKTAASSNKSEINKTMSVKNPDTLYETIDYLSSTHYLKPNIE